LTSEQLEAARAERMRQNGLGTLTFEDARTWIEETGLCLFLPRRQFLSSVAPSFVEAIAGRRDMTPDSRQIAAAEELLVRLETSDVAVRLNLQGMPGEQPDFVVASWVLPYVYALRGDRDWRRNPQLTGSRAVSQLAVQTYKLLEAGDQTVSQLKHALGREVTEAAVLRAITELWQQLRIIPVIPEAGRAAKWQLLRTRYQKAIAEGASTSQVTAISVLASIYLQAVIAASMEEVEVFLSPLTARSKVREVLRGLLATRQVHTISMGHAPHFYVAGTLPEFTPTAGMYGDAPVSSYFRSNFERDNFPAAPAISHPVAAPLPMAPLPMQTAAAEPRPVQHTETHVPRTPVHKPAAAAKTNGARPHFSRPVKHNRDRKPGASRAASSTNGSRIARRGTETRSSAPRSANGSRNGNGAHWQKSSNGKSNGTHAAKPASNGARSNGKVSHAANGANGARNGKPAASAWARTNGHARNGKPVVKASGARKAGLAHTDKRTDARASRKPALAAGAKAGNSKRYGFTARPKQRTKKRG
jgi:hypothetical protein